MKLSNKRELQQIAFNHSSDIDFRDFRNTYKKCPIKPYSFLETDTILLLHQIIFQVQKESFRKNIYIYIKKSWQLIIRLEMKNRNTMLSALSSGKIDKYEYLPGEEIVPSDQGGIIEHKVNLLILL